MGNALRGRRGSSGAPTVYVPLPPTRPEKVAYLATPQHRWLFYASALAFLGVAVSMGGMATHSPATVLFLVPLALWLVEQVVTLRTSTFTRLVTLKSHRRVVDGWRPAAYPSVDVFLPTCGEPLELLENTYAHVARLSYPGALAVYVLDDADRPEVARLAAHWGYRYLARKSSAFKKAGNLQYGLMHSTGDAILLLDADFVPRPEFLRETLPYLDDPTVGIVQTPQYFDVQSSQSWLQRCAGATQELFFRFIQPSRDAVGAAICVGTSAVYRRAALDRIGGFPQIGHSEDVFTGVHMGRAGYRVRYVPVLLSKGTCPDDLDRFIAQQYRWCEGTLSLVTDQAFRHDTRLTRMQRLSFWSGLLYYVTTALNALIAPAPLLVMVLWLPQHIAPINMLPLIGIVILWFVVLPMVSQVTWRVDVLRVQAIYGFAHLFCIVDMLSGHAEEWVPSGRVQGTVHVAARVRRFMVPYLVITQAVAIGGLIHGVWVYGIAAYWATVLFAALGAYILWPVAWLGARQWYVKRRPPRAQRANGGRHRAPERRDADGRHSTPNSREALDPDRLPAVVAVEGRRRVAVVPPLETHSAGARDR